MHMEQSFVFIPLSMLAAPLFSFGSRLLNVPLRVIIYNILNSLEKEIDLCELLCVFAPLQLEVLYSRNQGRSRGRLRAPCLEIYVPSCIMNQQNTTTDSTLFLHI